MLCWIIESGEGAGKQESWRAADTVDSWRWLGKAAPLREVRCLGRWAAQSHAAVSCRGGEHGLQRCLGPYKGICGLLLLPRDALKSAGVTGLEWIMSIAYHTPVLMVKSGRSPRNFPFVPLQEFFLAFRLEVPRLNNTMPV